MKLVGNGSEKAKHHNRPWATDPKRPNTTTGRAQASQKHKPEKMLPVTFGIHKTFVLVASTLAARLGPKNCWQRIRKGQTPLQAELGQAKNDAFATLPHGAETAASKP